MNLERDGFEIIEGVLARDEVERLIAAIARGYETGRAGKRQIHLAVDEIGAVIASDGIRGLAEKISGDGVRVVRSIVFDKTAEGNWGVPWHQDLTIAVAERREVAGFTGWSVKDGVNCVQAPREVLDGMLTVRLHLDDCGPENGPLRVLPGTHRHGWLDTEGIERLKREIPERVCVVGNGGALLMRPLLLHASARAVKPGHRRVLHLEFAATQLPGGLRFFGE